MTEFNVAEGGREARFTVRVPPCSVLAGRKEHPFAQPIWDIRLQAAWITFTGIYLIAGSKIMEYMAHPRWISSLFLTMSAILVLSLVCHTVVAKDKTASRKTLLVALTACLFFVQKSGETYHDNNGTMFAVIFSAVILSLVWLRDESSLREQIKFDTISVLVATIIYSIVGLMSTFGERFVIESRHSSENLMLIAPHVSSILIGTAAFFLSDNYIAEKIYSVEFVRYPLIDYLIRSLIVLIIAISVIYTTNVEGFNESILKTDVGIVFTIAYVVLLMFSVLACIWIIYTKRIANIFAKAIVMIALAVIAAVTVASFHIILQVLCEKSPSDFISLCINIYMLPAVSLIVATVLSNIIFRSVCRELYEAVAAIAG